jgi:SAM-dependent methyltransferase
MRTGFAVRPASDARARLLGDIVEWDVPNWSRALAFWGANSRQSRPGANALEIGGRGGGLSLWLALRGAHCVCTDVHGPSERAVELHRRYGVSGLLRYEAADALQLPWRSCFDVVAFKSVLGAIGRGDRKDLQQAAIRQMHATLKPGGELLFAENLCASGVHSLLRRRMVAWGSRWRYVTAEEMLEYLRPFARVSYVTFGVLGVFGRTAIQRRVLAVLDRTLIERMVPAHWHYIIAGVATK